MIPLAYVLLLVCLILNASLFFHLKWPDGGSYLWICHVISASLSPFFVVLGALEAGFGWMDHAPILVGMGVITAGLSLSYMIRVTNSQPGFDLAFGKHWQSRISPARTTRLLRNRWNVWLPRTKAPRVERNLPFWTIPGTERKLLCDLWQPPEDIPPTGLAFVYVHGGCWFLFDKDFGTRPFFRQLAAQGHVIMDVAYRLCPEVDIHGMVGDVKRAVAWMKANAGRYGVQPDRIILGGGSAGGHLALLAAYTPEHPRWNPADVQCCDLSVRAVVSLYGPTDLRACYEHLDQQRTIGQSRVQIGLPEQNKNFANAGRLDILLGGHPHEAAEVYELASPVTHVQSSCPPTLLIQGEPDVIAPTAATRALYQRLLECGVPAVNILYPLTDHAFDLVLPQVSPPAHAALYAIERFLALMASDSGVLDAQPGDGLHRQTIG